MRRLALCFAILGLTIGPAPAAQAPRFEARFILPAQEEHVHSSPIVELPNGDIFAVYSAAAAKGAPMCPPRGRAAAEGGCCLERAVSGRRHAGVPGLQPNRRCRRGRPAPDLWPAIVDNNWESAILRYRVAPTAGWSHGAPPLNDGGIILLRPDALQRKLEPFAKTALDSGLLPAPGSRAARKATSKK